MKQSILRWLAVLLLCLGTALAGYGGWTLIRGEIFQTSASVRSDSPAAPIISFTTPSSGFYSWNFHHTTNEMRFITTDEVLGPVIEKLELNRPEKASSSPQSLPIICEHLRVHVVVSLVHNTMILKITVRDSSPERAANIANTIAEVYRDNRLAMQKQDTGGGVRALEQRLTQSNSKVNQLTELATRRRNELMVSNGEEVGWSDRLRLATNALLDNRMRELRPFDEAMRASENAQQFQRILEQRLAMEKAGVLLPLSSPVQIMDRAVPSAVPVFPSRSISLSFLFAGIASAVVGGLLLRRQRG